MLDQIEETIKGKKVCIFGGNTNFMKYIIRKKYNVIVEDYTKNKKCDVLICYQDREPEIDILQLNREGITIIIAMEFLDSYNFELNFNYENMCLINAPFLSKYIKMCTLKRKKYPVEFEEVEPILKKYSRGLNNLVDVGESRLIRNMITNLIFLKLLRKNENNTTELLTHLSERHFPMIRYILNHKKNHLGYSDEIAEIIINKTNEYYEKEYFPVEMNFNVIDKLLDFIGNKSVLEMGSKTGFISYLLQNSNVNIVCIGSKDKYIESWTNIENIDVEKAFKKYNPEIVLMCYDGSNLNLDNFNGEYVILFNPKKFKLPIKKSDPNFVQLKNYKFANLYFYKKK